MFARGKPLQLSLMFVGKAGAYPSEARSDAPKLAYKYLTRLERPPRDKHSSLLQSFINYGCLKFYTNGPLTMKSFMVVIISLQK